MKMAKIFRTCFRHKSKDEEITVQPVQLRKEKSASKTSPRQSKTTSNYLHVSEIYSDEDASTSPSDDPSLDPLFSRVLFNYSLKSSSRNRSYVDDHYNQCKRSHQRRLLRKDKSYYDARKPYSSSLNVHDTANTLSNPNSKTMLKCVSLAVYLLVNDPLMKRQNRILGNVFKDTHNRKRSQSTDLKTIYNFVRAIFYYTRLSTECVIVALIYLERVLNYSQSTIDQYTWKRMLLGAIILASKVWDDQAVWNVDFCLVIKDLTVEEMNELERQYLILVHFNINVRSSVYAKYYFELRCLATSGIAARLYGTPIGGTKSTNPRCPAKQLTLGSKVNQSLQCGRTNRENEIASIEMGEPKRMTYFIWRQKSISVNNITNERKYSISDLSEDFVKFEKEKSQRFDRIILY
ncbi:hypothetical protein ACOME3_010319 [Neoechinorhynchus agilis]